MDELLFIGRSEDGAGLQFIDDAGHEFVVPIDDHLVHAITRPPKNVTEFRADEALTPREVQSRVRSGSSPATVAAESGVDLAWVMRFCGPVLAEREHIAQRAAETFLRPPHDDETLGSYMARHIVDEGGGEIEWDSWRREDGRWLVLVTWDQNRKAMWLFDVAARAITPFDEVASSLLKDEPPAPAESHLRLVTPASAPTTPVRLDEPAWDDILFGPRE